MDFLMNKFIKHLSFQHYPGIFSFFTISTTTDRITDNLH